MTNYIESLGWFYFSSSCGSCNGSNKPNCYYYAHIDYPKIEIKLCAGVFTIIKDKKSIASGTNQEQLKEILKQYE